MLCKEQNPSLHGAVHPECWEEELGARAVAEGTETERDLWGQCPAQLKTLHPFPLSNMLLNSPGNLPRTVPAVSLPQVHRFDG